jgi:hypothetical protein
VASPGRDTCQVDLAFSAYDWTCTEVTRVTTHRVTRGRLTSSCDVAADATTDWTVRQGHVAAWQRDKWQYGG